MKNQVNETSYYCDETILTLDRIYAHLRKYRSVETTEKFILGLIKDRQNLVFDKFSPLWHYPQERIVVSYGRGVHHRVEGCTDQ